MRTSVPTLLLIAASLTAAVDAAAEQAVRSQESAQRSVATVTDQTAATAGGLADDLRYNLVGDPSDAKQVADISTELAALTKAEGEKKTMPWVQDRLASARRGGGVAELGKAAVGQSELADQLDQLAKRAQGKLGGANGVNDLRNLIEAQQRIMEETAKLSDQTLGKDKENLSASERSDLERLAKQEGAIKDAIKDAVNQLREQAKNTANPNDKKNLENAARKLDQGQASSLAKQAAEQLSDNKLADAQQKQDDVLKSLQNADAAVSGMQEDKLAKLDARMQAMSQLAQKQQALLDQSKSQPSPSQAQTDSMAAQEQNLADQLARMQQPDQQGQDERQKQDPQAGGKEERQAQQAASEASKEMGKGDKGQAEKDMAKALAAMQTAQAAMAAQMAAIAGPSSPPTPPSPPGPPGPPSKPTPFAKEGAKQIGEDAGLENGDRKAAGRNGWAVDLAPQEREVLNQVKAERFPARYEQALMQYYRALADQRAEP